MSLLPQHVAIIMDGNGRWAKQRGRPRTFGHREGVKTVRHIVEVAGDLGLRYLTLYSFSTENWQRPKAEIRILFDLLRRYVDDDLDSLHENGVCIRILGSTEGLSDDLLELIHRVQKTTAHNTRFFLNIAFNYGGRDEIVRAVQRAAAGGINPQAITQADITNHLDTAGMPDPDLIIRTSGEKRISNYLIWQAAYSEFYFTDTLWPDFSEKHLKLALADYASRRRRYGGLDAESGEEVA